MQGKRTQAERTAASRSRLIAAGRALFGARSFAEVSAEEVARAAGLSRGALYHQFGGMPELFAAVLDEVESEVMGAVAGALNGRERDVVVVLASAIDAWLQACRDPAVTRILLLDGPVVLGWERWRDIGRSHSLRLIEAQLGDLIAAGLVAPQPVRPLAHVLVGSLHEAALYAARSSDPETDIRQVRDALLGVVRGLLRPESA